VNIIGGYYLNTIYITPTKNRSIKVIMEKKMIKTIVIGVSFVATLFMVNPVWAQSSGHASVGLGHGEEGYLHLQEMIKHYEFSLQMQDTSEELKIHGSVALKHAKEAIKHYNEALKHGNESLGRRASAPMAEGSPGEEGHSHDEGSH
jgi:hypothetical protein